MKMEVDCDMMYRGGVPMLKSFALQNAFSFADRHELDMQATGIKAHGYSLITNQNNKNIPLSMEILPVMSIYGANASGKSNLIRSIEFAFRSIALRATNHFMLPFMMGNYSEDERQEIEEPFFELVFLLDKNEYTLTVRSIGLEFYYENLSYRKASRDKQKLIYCRAWNEKTEKWSLKVGSTIDADLIEEIRYVSKMERGSRNLLLSALCNRGVHDLFKSISRWVSRFDTEQYTNRSSVTAGPLFTSNKINPYFRNLNEPRSKEKVLRFLQSMNPHIKGYEFAKSDLLEKHKDMLKLVFKYDIKRQGSSDSEQIDEILSDYESRGIYSAFTLMPAILTALENGGLIIIDELENSLHPLLMAKVINMFTDPDTNVGGGQLIFTTHNALIMNNKYLRQDEICFVEKDDKGKSELYKLSDIDGVRSDLDFCKNYILGAFGAIPKL